MARGEVSHTTARTVLRMLAQRMHGRVGGGLGAGRAEMVGVGIGVAGGGGGAVRIMLG